MSAANAKQVSWGRLARPIAAMLVFALLGAAIGWGALPGIPTIGPGKPKARLQNSSLDSTVVYTLTKYTHVGTSSSTTEIYDDSFTPDSVAGWRFVVEIVNGSPTASLIVFSNNSQQFVGSSQFGSSTTRLLQPIDATSGSNSIEVQIKGAHNAYVYVRIVRVKDPTWTVYGRTTFTRPGTIGAQTDTFRITTSKAASAPFTLHAINGSPNGANRMTTASDSINGAVVMTPSDFGTGIAALQRNITLHSPTQQDTLSLLDQSASGANVTLWVTATDSLAPQVALTSPSADTTYTASSAIAISGSIASPTTCWVTVNGSTVSVVADTFHTVLTLPTDGVYNVTVYALGANSLDTTLTRVVYRDATAPLLSIASPNRDSTVAASTDSITVIGYWADLTPSTTTVDGDTVGVAAGDTLAPLTRITEESSGIHVAHAGAFQVRYALDPGMNRILVRAVDAAGNTQQVLRMIYHDMDGASVIDSTIYAPSPTGAKTPLFAKQVAFLYGGDTHGNVQQHGVTVDSLAPALVSVICGRVTARDYGGLPNVSVRVLGHPEYGYSQTRSDGRFDMVVNGGAPLTLRFIKPGFLEAQRVVSPAVNEFASEDTVALTGKSVRAQTVSLATASVVRGRFSSDESGDRDVRVYFQAGTVAKIPRTDGDTASLSLLHMRITEYTVGQDGPRTMPAQMPPASAYTYCVDVTVDEADSIGQAYEPTLPAPDVFFSKPVTFYVGNFRGCPVGSVIPEGYYERRTGEWYAGEDGRVLRLLPAQGGGVTVDADGDGLPDDSTHLAAMGITAGELAVLATQYRPGEVLWRMTTDRFSSPDCNLGVMPDPHFAAPNVVAQTDREAPFPCTREGSVVDCDDRILGEEVPLAGVPFSLCYRSVRAQGDAVIRTVRVPVVGAIVPQGVISATVELDVAGRSYSTVVQGPITLSSEPVTITWDGRDAYGRFVSGAVPAKLRIGYLFSYSWIAGTGEASFDDPSADGGVVGPATGDGPPGLMVWNEQGISLGGPSAPSDGLGGWTISAHHFYDAAGSGTVYLGDGSVIEADAPISAAYVGYGTGTADASTIDQLQLWSVVAMAKGPGRSLYVLDGARNALLSIDGNGNVLRVAGNKSNGSLSEGVATASPLPAGMLHDLAIGPDGTIYLECSDTPGSSNNFIAAVTSDGHIRRVIGGVAGTVNGGGDGLPCSQAWTGRLGGLAVGPDGSIYFGDESASPTGYRIRRIATNGIVTTYAGTGVAGWNNTVGLASQTAIGDPLAMKVDDNGVLYVIEGEYYDYNLSNTQLRRIEPTGVIRPLPALWPRAPFYGFGTYMPRYLDLGDDGSLYIGAMASNGVGPIGAVLRRAPDSTVTIVEGNGTTPLSAVPAEGLPGTALYGGGGPIARDGVGGVLFGGYGIMRLQSNFVSRGREIRVPSRDGRELYVFSDEGDSLGRHLYTRDALTGGICYSFAYDTSGRLIAIRDAGGLVTTIQRDNAGTPLAVVSPFGQRTRLALDGNGYLSSIEDTIGNTIYLTTASNGLLTSYTDARGNAHTMAYAPDGRLHTDDGPVGTGATLTLDGPAYDGARQTVTATTGQGRHTSYSVANLWDTTRQREVIDPDGEQAFETDSSSGQVRWWLPDGSSEVDSLVPDSRFGIVAPVAALERYRLPSGMSETLVRSRSLTAGFDPPAVNGLWAEDVSLNSGPSSRIEFHSNSPDSLRVRSRSPFGRVRVADVDSVGRLLTLEQPGLADLHVEYDAVGRQTEVTQGGRGFRFGYNSQGRLSEVRDTLGRMTTYGYDVAGRLSELHLPGGREVGCALDANGNVTALSNPQGNYETYTYNAVNRLSEAFLPAVGGSGTPIEYTYDGDCELTEVHWPASTNIDIVHGSATAALDSLVTAAGTIELVHNSTGTVHSISCPDNVTLTYGYDGSIDTLETYSGQLVGAVSVAVTRDLQISSMRINGANAVAYQYDPDGLVTQAGALAIERRSDNGLIAGTSIGGFASTLSYSSLGELWHYVCSYGGNTIYEVQYDRDSLGRVVGWNETDSTAHVYRACGYGSPDTGFVSSIVLDGSTVSACGFDANGNRVSAWTAGDPSGDSVLTGTYDSRDRLVRWGDSQYAYDETGALTTMLTPRPGASLEYGDGGIRYYDMDTTSYTYDAIGSLKSVRLPGGRNVQYIVDGRGRRVGRVVDGVCTNRWLYQDQLSPVAEVDSTGGLVAQYVYGTRLNVPDYIIRDGHTYAVCADERGSVRVIIDVNSGALVQQLGYDVWGNVLYDTNPGFQPFGFAGGIWDPATGLLRCGARDYDPHVGRWTMPDPDWTGATVGASPYVYAGDDPVNCIDEDGVYWTYSQSSGEVTHVDPDGSVNVYHDGSYSGVGWGLWNPAANDVKNIGPISRGEYTIGHPYDDPSHMGPFVLPLTPAPGQPWIMRKGFAWHGDETRNPGKHLASTGCIVSSRKLRQRVWDSNDHDLRVIR